MSSNYARSLQIDKRVKPRIRSQRRRLLVGVAAAIGAAPGYGVACVACSRLGVVLQIQRPRLELAGAAALLLLSIGQSSGLLLQTGFRGWHFVSFTDLAERKEPLLRPLYSLTAGKCKSLAAAFTSAPRPAQRKKFPTKNALCAAGFRAACRQCFHGLVGERPCSHSTAVLAWSSIELPLNTSTPGSEKGSSSASNWLATRLAG